MQTKIPTLVMLSMLGSFANASSCYTLVDQKNAIVFQSTKSPIDLSRKISDEINAKFPGEYLIITDGESCQDINRPTSKDSGKNSIQMTTVESSKLFTQYETPNIDTKNYLSADYSILRQGKQQYGSSHSPGTDIYVKSYTKSDGTNVKAYTRAASGRGR
jgi:hypothetical protein